MESDKRIELIYNQEIWQLDLNIAPPIKGGEDSRAYNRQVAQQKDLLDVLKIINNEEPGLVTGELNISLPEARVRDLFEKIQQNCNGYQLRRRHNFFRKGLMKGEEMYNWKIPIPEPMIILPRERSPFTPNSFAPLSSLQKLIDLFQNSLTDPNFYLTPEQYIKQAIRVGYSQRKIAPDAEQLLLGQILFSAVVNGALLNKKWIVALLEGLLTSIVARDKMLWLELKINIGKSDQEIRFSRRWFVDPTTAVLILYWHKTYANKSILLDETNAEKLSNNLLNRYLSCLGLCTADRPSFSKLTSVASTRLRLKLPPFLVTYAESLMLAPSLSPMGWARLQLNKISNVPVSLPGHENQGTSGNGIKKSLILESKPNEDLPDQIEELRKVQKLLRGDRNNKNRKSKKKILAEIQNILDSGKLAPVTMVLIEWTKKLLSERRQKKTNPAKSVSQYLYAIGKPLITYGDGYQIQHMKSLDWENLYDQVLETAVSPNNRTTKGSRLKEFHDYLMQTYDVPYVDIEDVAGGVRIANANIITPHEYTVISNYLGTNPYQIERLRKIHQIFFCLCYRLGLRRAEVQRIRLIDFPDLFRLDEIPLGSLQDIDRFELLIRNTSHGKVKTNKSTRRLPLHLLLTKFELELLQSWIKLRLTEIGDTLLKDQLLLCLEGDDTTTLSKSRLYDPIQTALREITRDPEITIHNLRHSFASFLLLMLFVESIPDLIPETWRKKEDDYFLSDQLPYFHLQLLLREDLHSTKRLLYLVSNLCGHVDPTETQITYLHLYDWMLGVILKQQQQALPQSVQAIFLGLSHANWRSERTRKKILAGNTTREFLEILLDRLANPTVPQERSMIPLPDIFAKEIRLDDPITLLQIIEKYSKGVGVEDISLQYNCPINLIETWVVRAQQLGSQTTNRGNQSLGKKTRKSQLKGPQLDFWPSISKDKDDHEDARKIFNAVTNPEDEEKGSICRKGVELYIQRATRSDSKIRPRTDEEKKIFVKFLKTIGFADDRIIVTLYPNPDILETCQQEYWAELFSLPCSSIVISNRDFGKRPIHPYGRTIIRLRRNQLSKNPNETNYSHNEAQTSGLMLGIFMAKVYLGD